MQTGRRFSFARYAERLNALLAIVWGLWVVVFHSGNTIFAYAQLEQFVPLWVIALLLVICGSSLLIFPRLNTHYKYLHLLLFALWLVIACAFLLNDLPNTGGPVYLTLALVNGGFYWRLTHLLHAAGE